MEPSKLHSEAKWILEIQELDGKGQAGPFQG